MPRKTRRPPPFVLTAPAARRSHVPVWLGYLLTALLAAAVGAGGMYLAKTRPAQKHAQDLQAQINQFQATLPPTTPAGPATAPGVPPPGLTAGLDPAHAALNLGNWYEDHADWPHAVANYSLAIADGTDDPDIRTDLGVAFYRSGQPQKALAQYQNAQKQNPAHENSLFNQGAAYAQLGQSARAVAIWQRYLARFPQGQHDDDARQLIAAVQTQGLPGAPGTATPPR